MIYTKDFKNTDTTLSHYLTVDRIEQAQRQIQNHIKTTPLYSPWGFNHYHDSGPDGDTQFKLECWQVSGSFKIRAALLNIMQLTSEQKKRGIVAVSGGNHAVAICYASHLYSIPTTVIMPKYASEARIRLCKQYGANIVFKENLQACFDTENSYTSQGLTRIHPFEGETVALGTGTLGLEIINQWPSCDAIIIAIGGGGLCGGIANAIKQIKPSCEIYGVEPINANSMTLSIQQRNPIDTMTTNTIADSLAAPHSLPYSYSLCERYLDGIANVTEKQIIEAMKISFESLKLALEPAAATAVAGLLGPCKETLFNKRVLVLVCGSNYDTQSFCNAFDGI